MLQNHLKKCRKSAAKMCEENVEIVARMYENGCQKDAKLRLGGFLGPLLEALGAMWVPRGVPMLKNNEKLSILLAF